MRHDSQSSWGTLLRDGLKDTMGLEETEPAVKDVRASENTELDVDHEEEEEEKEEEEQENENIETQIFQAAENAPQIVPGASGEVGLLGGKVVPAKEEFQEGDSVFVVSTKDTGTYLRAKGSSTAEYNHVWVPIKEIFCSND